MVNQPPDTAMRLDPCPSKVFSWLSYDPNAPEVKDENTGRMIRPAGPTLTVRYRYNGAEHEFWPVDFEEAREVMNPGPKYNFSIGAAFSSIIKAHKSSRSVRLGDRQATKKQSQPESKPATRRWLA